MNACRPQRPHPIYTLHTLSIGEAHKVRQRGVLSNALQEREDCPRRGKKKHGVTQKKLKWVKESKNTPGYEKKTNEER